jgi:hypothetical protein
MARASFATFTLIVLSAAGAPPPLHAQSARDVPVVRANSPVVNVRDGHNFRKGLWTIDPAAKLDVYYAQRSSRPKKVTFVTDVESISFDVEPGRDYDFVILLDGTRRCPTRISGLRRSGRPEGGAELARPFEIPFTLGDDNVLRITGTINGSAPLTFMVDMGADTTVVYDSAFGKGLKVSYDGTIPNAGMGGVVTRQTSSDNRLLVNGLLFEHEQVMHIGKQGRGVDGIIGYNLFEDRALEFDYDRSVLVVHPAAPTSLDGYANGEMEFRGTIPSIEATLGAGAKRVTDWFVFDTGYTGSVHLSRDFWENSGLAPAAEIIGKSSSEGVGPAAVRGVIVRLPALTVGGHTLKDVPTNVEAQGGGHQSTGMLGMEVLKRYNAVLDFQNNVAYLKPRSTADAPFKVRGRDVRRVVALAVLAVLVVALITYVLARRRRARRHQPDTAESL